MKALVADKMGSLAVSFVLFFMCAAVTYVAAGVPGGLLALAACASLATFALLVPPINLASAAIAATLLIPTSYISLGGIPKGFPLGLPLLLLWLFTSRSPNPRSPSLPLGVAGALLGGWVLFSLALGLAQHRLAGGVATLALWPVTCLSTVCAAAVLGGRTDLEWVRRQRTVLLMILSALAAFALVEVYLLKSNPLYGGLYAQSVDWARQGAAIGQWGIYRATTTLGHPLTNGTLFAVGTALALAEVVRGRSATGRSGFLVWVLCWAGLLSTASRGPMIAAVVGNLVVLLATFRGQHLKGRAGVAAIAFVLVAGLAFSQVAARNATEKGATSLQYRYETIGLAEAATRGTSVFGVGPGQAQQWRVRQGFSSRQALENSWAELAVSLGLGGAFLFGLVLLLAALQGLRDTRVVGEAAGLVVIGVAATGFNMLEGNPSVMVITAVLMWSVRAADSGRLR